MRVAFMGASGTGKTTLARWVQNTYTIPFINVGSRSVAKEMGYDNPYDVDRDGRRAEFQGKLQSRKIALELEKEDFVTDRTTIDELAYSYIHDFVNGVGDGLEARTVTDGYKYRALHHLSRYDYVFWCSIAAFQDLGNDPSRVKDQRYHEMHEALMFGILTTNFQGQLPFVLVEIDAAVLEARQAKVQATIAKPLASPKRMQLPWTR